MTETKKTINPGTYKAKTDDCISSIGFESGFFPETLWELPENAELKKKRKSLNVLQEGDSIHIPEVRKRTSACQTGKAHKFKLKGVPEKLKLRFLEGGEPRSGIEYTLEVDDKKIEGKTDEDGVIEHWISPSAKKGKFISPILGTYDLSLGGLNPENSETGAKSRLVNLGYILKVDADGADLEEAIKSFQSSNKLEATGKLDEETKAKLLKVHGG
jgi:hypothetical protein